MAAENVQPMITREEFQQFRHLVADEFERINAAIVALHAEHLEVIAIVREGHDLNKQRILALQELLQNFLHRFGNVQEPVELPPVH